ncbi:hypothetical protein DICA1_D21792 [Diutina catenulata]
MSLIPDVVPLITQHLDPLSMLTLVEVLATDSKDRDFYHMVCAVPIKISVMITLDWFPSTPELLTYTDGHVAMSHFKHVDLELRNTVVERFGYGTTTSWRIEVDSFIAKTFVKQHEANIRTLFMGVGAPDYDHAFLVRGMRSFQKPTKFPNLEELCLMAQKSKDIEVDLSDMIHLKRVSLGVGGIFSLPPNVEDLLLNASNITITSSEFNCLQRLTIHSFRYLSTAHISMPLALKQFPVLQELCLWRAVETEVDRWLCLAPNLRRLVTSSPPSRPELYPESLESLEDNFITYDHDLDFSYLLNLKSLTLEYAHEIDINLPHGLEELNVPTRNIKVYPNSLRKLKIARRYGSSSDVIGVKLPDHVEEFETQGFAVDMSMLLSNPLPRLKSIVLNLSILSNMTDFSGLAALKNLEMRNTAVSIEKVAAPNLESLVISRAGLTQIPDVPSTLTSLDLSENKIENVPDFERFFHLKSLNLASNNIGGSLVIKAPKLESLFCNHNSITRLVVTSSQIHTVRAVWDKLVSLSSQPTKTPHLELPPNPEELCLVMKGRPLKYHSRTTSIRLRLSSRFNQSFLDFPSQLQSLDLRDYKASSESLTQCLKSLSTLRRLKLTNITVKTSPNMRFILPNSLESLTVSHRKSPKVWWFSFEGPSQLLVASLCGIKWTYESVDGDNTPLLEFIETMEPPNDRNIEWVQRTSRRNLMQLFRGAPQGLKAIVWKGPESEALLVNPFHCVRVSETESSVAKRFKVR